MHLSGTFFCPHERFFDWDARAWEQEAVAMQQIGLRTLIVGWTSWSGERVFGFASRVMEMAQQHGFEVYLGLATDRGWWTQPQRLYADLLRECLGVATDLHRQFDTHPSFAGWYLTTEIDPARWRGPAQRRLIDHYLRPLRTDLLALDPRPMLVSPYFGSRSRPQANAAWWQRTVREVPIDVLALQDGVGCGRTRVDRVGGYLGALADALKGSGTHLWGNVEVFRQTRPWPLPFRAVPASASRVASQMQAAAPHVERLICFEFPTYLSPHRGPLAERLYNGYRRLLKPT